MASVKKVVLLTDHDPDLQTRRCIEQIRTGLAGDYEFALEEVGADGFSRTLSRVFGVRRLAREAALVHAWGYRALKVASFAANGPLLYTPAPEDQLKAVRWVLSAIKYQKLRVLCLSEGDHRFMMENGVPVEVCEVIRPGVRMPRTVGRDAELRRKLGIAEDEVAILGIGESLPHANHLLALHASAILHFMDRRFRFVVWGRGPGAASLERLQQCWEVSCMINAQAVLGETVEFEQLIPAADLGVVTSEERLSVQPLLACMAGGLPLAAPATYAVSEILEDRHTATLYPGHAPRMIAHKILGLSEDETLRRRVADQARAEAYELFAVSRFLDEVRRAYAGEKVAAETQAPKP
jgi:glycosyltransferase involved in cell wall biosynthesis